jgi:hypothetical protein
VVPLEVIEAIFQDRILSELLTYRPDFIIKYKQYHRARWGN